MFMVDPDLLRVFGSDESSFTPRPLYYGSGPRTGTRWDRAQDLCQCTEHVFYSDPSVVFRVEKCCVTGDNTCRTKEKLFGREGVTHIRSSVQAERRPVPVGL